MEAADRDRPRAQAAFKAPLVPEVTRHLRTLGRAARPAPEGRGHRLRAAEAGWLPERRAMRVWTRRMDGREQVAWEERPAAGAPAELVLRELVVPRDGAARPVVEPAVSLEQAAREAPVESLAQVVYAGRAECRVPAASAARAAIKATMASRDDNKGPGGGN